MVEKSELICLDQKSFRRIRTGDSLYHIRGRGEDKLEANVTSLTNGGESSVAIMIDKIVVDRKDPTLVEGDATIATIGEIFRKKS